MQRAFIIKPYLKPILAFLGKSGAFLLIISGASLFSIIIQRAFIVLTIVSGSSVLHAAAECVVKERFVTLLTTFERHFCHDIRQGNVTRRYRKLKLSFDVRGIMNYID
ncbi:hypothetical protein CEXT_159031 [Caerostris extrusa]|uniref:Uncharacterized protein n=1 Tax=Caerostris extrusa TaxID=172846 RepID=A0AAV4XSV8_CAEEX|nr:hypothetical protein CEXT_159031 [Caerostris extrusa]